MLREEREVVAQARFEELDVLGDDPDRVSQRAQGQRAHVLTTDAHRAVRGVVEAQEQPCHRALATSGAPDNPEDATGGHRERHVVERGRAVAVAEGDVVERDRERAYWERVDRSVDHRRLEVEQLPDPRRARARLLQRPQLVGDDLERAAHELDRLEEEEHGADGHRARVVESDAHQQRQHRARRECGVARGADLGRAPLGAGPGTVGSRTHLVEPAHRVVAAAVRPHVLETGETFLDRAEEIGARLTMRGGRGNRVVARTPEHQQRDRGEHEEDEPGAPVLHGHEHEDACEHDPGRDDLQDDLRVVLGDPRDVAVHAFDQLAGAVTRQPRMIQ